MAKSKPPKAGGNKPAQAKGKGSTTSSSLPAGAGLALIGLVGVGVAIALQSFLTATQPSVLDSVVEEPQAPPREPTGPPARCIDDWAECPRVPGADWVALAQLEESLDVEALDAGAIAACKGPTPLLSAEPVLGMHLLCVLPAPMGEEARVAATLAVFTSMERRERPSRALLLPPLAKADDIVAALRYKLRFPRRGPKYQPPALFTEAGVRLVHAEPALGRGPRALHRLLCLEGGQWLWPPVEVGHVHILPNLTAPGVDTRVVTVSLKPLVVEVENFLNPAEVT